MMNKQRLAMIGCVGFFLFLALVSLPTAGKPAKADGNQPQSVAAPLALPAPAKSTPVPVSVSKQPSIQPIPLPVPTPERMAEAAVSPSTQAQLPARLPGFLLSGTVVLILGFALRLSRQRTGNGRSLTQNALAKGVKA